MDDFIQIPPGQSIVEFLGTTHPLPPVGIRLPGCACCQKKINVHSKRSPELRLALTALKMPIIFICPLCNRCSSLYRRKGRSRLSVLRTVTQFLQDEVMR